MDTPPKTGQVSAAQLFAMAIAPQTAPDQAAGIISVLKRSNGLIAGAGSLASQHENAGRYALAEQALRAALLHAPGDQDLQWRLAHSRLRAGDFSEGWALMRSRPIEITLEMKGRPVLPFPEWTGGPVSSLLVICEQGLGDQIQFARYLPVLSRRGINVSFLCAPTLLRLLAPLGAALYSAISDAAMPRADAWVMMMSLPEMLHTQLATIPPAPYLPGALGGAGIGVMSNGRPGHANDANRSLPEAFRARLLALPGAIDLAPSATGAKDFEDTRQIIEGLAQVISVDTAIAHLAGAMGKPCKLLLPFMPDWRWMLGRDDSPWYPSIRLYRQPAPGDWASAVEAAVRDI